MPLGDGVKVRDFVKAELVDCTPEKADAPLKDAFIAGYHAAIAMTVGVQDHSRYPWQPGAEEAAWERFVEQTK